MTLKQALESILEQPCWRIIAGSGTGSIVLLGFGKKITKKMSSKNPNLTEDERKHDADMNLMVHCAWRISSSNSVICSWRDSNRKDGPMLIGLNLLRNAKVQRITLNPVSYDLKIDFDNEMVFEIFCDITEANESEDNYWFSLENKIYEVKFKSQLTVSY